MAADAKQAAASALLWAVLITDIPQADSDELFREIVRQADTRDKRAALGKLAELLKQAWVGTL